ncbi:Ldh family oxidoreductase, partial [Pantoea sp. SIMBA_133]
LTQLVETILLKGGLSPLHANALTRVIVAGERDACKSHGVYRIEGCLRTIKAGKVVPDAEPELTSDESAIVRVAAKGGFANAAFEL